MRLMLLIKRVNRKLVRSTEGARNLKLRKSTPKQSKTGFGNFYISNTETGEVISKGVSLSQYARMFGISTEGVRFEGGYCSIPESAVNVQ